MSRILTLTLLGLLMALGLASSAWAAAPSFRWTLEPTATVAAERGSADAQRWLLEVSVRDPGRFLCLDGDDIWELDGAPIAAEWRGFCRYRLRLDRLGTRRLSLTTRAPGRPGRRSATATLDLRQLTVAIVGDSVASGEGTPDRRFVALPRWRDRDCRRSDAAGASRAVADLERGDPGTAIRLINLACSGAGLERGLLAGQGAPAPLAQLAAARAALGSEKPDALIVVAGANDAGFDDLVRTCLIADGDCRSLPAALGRPPLAEDLAGRISRLPGLYDTVAGCLRGRDCPAGGSPVLAADRVVIAPYFDPAGDDDGQTCRFPSFTTGPAITASEMAWARTAVLGPLNSAVTDAATRNGWAVAAEVPGAFATHGVCARDSWIIPPKASLLRQGDLRGTFHPNDSGHDCYAAAIGAALAPILRADGLRAPVPHGCSA